LDEIADENERSREVRRLLDLAFGEEDRQKTIEELEEALSQSREMYLRELEINERLRQRLDMEMSE
jgi:hypothetical protein